MPAADRTGPAGNEPAGNRPAVKRPVGNRRLGPNRDGDQDAFNKKLQSAAVDRLIDERTRLLRVIQNKSKRLNVLQTRLQELEARIRSQAAPAPPAPAFG